MPILAFSGSRKSGKTLASGLVTKLDARFHKRSFADPVREMFSKETGIGLKTLTDNSAKEEYRERLIAFAEGLRAKDELIFIKALFDSITPDEYIVIDDLRLLRELEHLVKNKAIIFRVEADKHVRRKRGWVYFPAIDEHITETDLDLCQETYVKLGGGIVRNNGTIEELEHSLSLILLKFF